jgi:phage-related protein
MTETFTWAPRIGPTGTVSFRTLDAQFGDGYAQVTQDGINNRAESWPVTFQGSAEKIAAVRAFLDRHAGARSFLWTPPGGKQGYYKAKTYSPTAHDKFNSSISATFEQVFFP